MRVSDGERERERWCDCDGVWLKFPHVVEIWRRVKGQRHAGEEQDGRSS